MKRARQALRRRDRNRYFRSTARTYVKRARRLIDAGNVSEAESVVDLAFQSLDKAAQKGIIHKNNAARGKSRLMKALNRARQASGE